MMLRVASLRLSGAAVLLFAAAVPAMAAGNPPQQAQNAAPSDQANETNAAPVEAASQQPKEERKICRLVNGSEARLGRKKVCMTAEQWKHADDDD